MNVAVRQGFVPIGDAPNGAPRSDCIGLNATNKAEGRMKVAVRQGFEPWVGL